VKRSEGTYSENQLDYSILRSFLPSYDPLNGVKPPPPSFFNKNLHHRTNHNKEDTEATQPAGRTVVW
jgi:hypothetical protein